MQNIYGMQKSSSREAHVSNRTLERKIKNKQHNHMPQELGKNKEPKVTRRKELKI